MNKKILILGVLTLAVAAILLSCAPEELDGSVKTNVPPRIGITNIDYYDSLFTFNAVINWYGTDADGQVMYYYYKVVLSNEVGDSLQAYDYIDTALANLGISEWTQTEERAATIQMYASDNENDTLYQYVFFKCEDDEGAFSDIIFYALYRVNRLPETELELLPGNFTRPSTPDLIQTLPVWCLPDTNSMWSGLSFDWSGDDTLDFPDGAPDFEFKWELYGPYDTSYFSYSDSLIALSYDDISTEALYIKSCADDNDGFVEASQACDERWVWDKTKTLTNLRSGCYIFVVTTRDDARVPDPTPAWGTFVVIEPDWSTDAASLKDILIVQATQYNTIAGRKGWPPEWVYLENDTLYFPDEVMDFYSDMIGAAGDYTYDIYGDPAIGFNTNSDFPTMFDIAHYRMLIFDDMDYLKIELAYNEDRFVPKLRDYLSIGGKIWVIGRQCFLDAGGNYAGFKNFGNTSLAYEFFDLSSAYYTEMDFASDSAEFLGAYATVANFGINYLVIDPVKTGYLSQHGVNKVEVLVRNSSRSQTLFIYDAANPDTMGTFQYMPCATVFTPEHQVFQTSYFSFPLYLMDNSAGQVATIFDEMLYWFLGY